MDKKQVLAIVLSALIVIAGFTVNNVFFSKQPAEALPSASAAPAMETARPEASSSLVSNTGDTAVSDSSLVDPSLPAYAIVPAGTNVVPVTRTYRNDVMEVTLSGNGGNVASIHLIKYTDSSETGEPVEMILPGNNSGIQLRLGDRNGSVVDVPFELEPQTDPSRFVFHRDFQVNSRPGELFRITRAYTFHDGEYAFDMDITLQNAKPAYLPLDGVGKTYTISLEPQIGPLSTVHSQGAKSGDFRRFAYLPSGSNDKKVENLSPGNIRESKDLLRWAAVDSKYFSFFIMPGAAEYALTMVSSSLEDGNKGDSLFLTRSPIQSDKVTDRFTFYAGPKLAGYLDNYNKTEDNNAGISGANLDKIVDGDILGWLSEGLKFLLQLFYWLIPNWGVAILLLTLLVKVALFPLTKKSMESTARMQELNPQLQALREKYQDNPQKLNLETAELYKREKINPLGGCLPMLLQMPFFFAMYGLFSNHFDLRGAMFIPGWITDLSRPETVMEFQFSFLGFFNMSGLHLLPFIYLGTQLLNGLFTQNNGGQSNGQMKFMMFGMPIMFFFILYEVPAGLLVYWIFQNVLNIAQQLVTNRFIKNHKQQNPDKARSRLQVVQGSSGKKPRRK